MTHEIYMKRCIQLAKNGLGTTYPNPLVGSVIVHRGKIIGEGWHHKAGFAHAEVNAVASVKQPELLLESTIYVNLEPCSHFGKTPPCADMIIEKGIKKVVIGCVDTFAKVCGRGIQKLKEAGCEVTVGVLEDECIELNKRFFTYHQKKRPYIFLKWAMTKDGFIAPKEKEKIAPYWISNPYSRQKVHQMRAEEQAILVGTTTVLDDNPKLDVREWHGGNPLRVIIDRTLKIPSDFSIYDDTQTTLIFTEKEIMFNTIYKNTNFKQIDFQQDMIQQILNVLFENQVQSLIVEGGSSILQQCIEADLWDEAHVFVGQNQFNEGLKAPKLNKEGLVSTEKIVDDTYIIYKNRSNG